PRTEIVLGPWTHGGEDSDRSGERVFGPQAVFPYAREVMDFLDLYVRGVEPSGPRPARVRAFVMGENVWRSGDAFPLPGTQTLSLSLVSRGKLARSAPWAGASASSSFVSDPANPVVDPYGEAYGAHDYRALATRKDVLVFETEPLAEPLRVV